jgi:hypothetical protein
MSDPTYTEAWAEAAASNRRKPGRLVTIEFLHPGIVAEGIMVPVRAVAARKPVMLRLEAGHPIEGDAGQLVEFKPLTFTSAQPARTANGSLVSRVSIANIGGELWKYVEAACEMQADAILILREYFKANPDEVAAGPIRFTVTGATIANGTVEGDCTLDTQSDLQVPTLKYTADRFAALNG